MTATAQPVEALLPLAKQASAWVKRFVADHPQAELIARTTALLCQHEQKGHVCVCLPEWAGQPVPWDPETTFPDWPAWEAALTSAPCCSDGTEAVPLVLQDGLAYLYRLWHAELDLARAIGERLRVQAATDLARWQKPFAAVFGTPGDATDWQGVAAFTALRQPFSIVTGGPGTGKTYTAAKILQVLLGADPDLTLALAAPTGKAADRLSALIAQAGLTTVPPAKTLHRLLAWRRDGTFRHNADNPLTEDVLLLDEASMISLDLLHAVLLATPAKTRIILLGDSGQLASIGVGAVLGDLCLEVDSLEAPGKSPAFASAFTDFAGHTVPVSPHAGALVDCVTRLDHSYRSAHCPTLNRLAAAVRRGQGEAVKTLLDAVTGTGGKDVQVTEVGPKTDNTDLILDTLLPWAEAVVQAPTPAAALRTLDTVRLLTPFNVSRYGTETLNRQVESSLQRAGRIPPDAWYRGRPILITENSYPLELFNGNVGVFGTGESETGVWFTRPDGTLRCVPTNKLPAHQTAWCMTIHKSQGSEFAEVILLIPATDSPILTRELLYTGLTRASSHVHLLGSKESVQKAVDNPARRYSGLRKAIAEMGPTKQPSRPAG